MIIQFLKQHDIYNAGEIADLPDGLANYLIRVGAAESYSEHEDHVKEKVVRKHPPEKAQIIKPPSKKRIKKPGS